MTPGWRRWAAILTTYTCLLAGATPYRIRVPPPGQLVALSGDDLRVELDLPPPGRGPDGGASPATGAPDPRSRRQGEVGGGEEEGGGKVKRDGELWIELVDMEMGAEKARQRRRRLEVVPEEEEEGSGGRRWRREEGGGGEGSRETMGRREIGGGWNSVEGKEDEEEKGRGKEGPAEKKETKRYGWVAGGVRPKGEREKVAKAKGAVGGAGGGPEGSGKRAGEDRWSGKLRWRSWNGRGLGGGNSVRVTEKGGELAREKKGGERAGEGVPDGGGANEEVVRGEAAGEGEGEEEDEATSGLILETALVSRGWHLPVAPPKGSPHRGPTPPHSTLALTFPASHFTHGGLYVVRLVGTGRVVSNSGTQRPPRGTTTTEGAFASREEAGSTADPRMGERVEGGKPGDGNGTLEASGKYKPEGIRANGSLERGGKNAEKGVHVEGDAGMGKKAAELNPSLRSNDAHESRESVTTGVRSEGDKENMRRMYDRILEALENREMWEEYDRGAVPTDRKSSGDSPEEGDGADGSGVSRELQGLRAGGRKRREADPSGWKQKTVTKRWAGQHPDGGEADARMVDGVLSEADGSAEGAVRGLKWPDHSAVSDYGEDEGWRQRSTDGPWQGGTWGGRVVSRSWSDQEGRFVEGEYLGRGRKGTSPLESSNARRRRDGEMEVSGTKTSAAPKGFLRAYLEEKVTALEEKKGKEGRDFNMEGGSDEKFASALEESDRSKSGRIGHNLGERGNLRRRNEEGSVFDEPILDQYTEGTTMKNVGITNKNSDLPGSLRIYKREVERPKELNETETGEEISRESIENQTKEDISSLTTTTEGRVQREVGKACKENCDTTTTSRHILAEENVLVSWPAARFTLNILTSSSFSSPVSAPKSKTEAPARNLTFDTFEAPVRVLVEIPCGIEGVSRRVRRDTVDKNFRKTMHIHRDGVTGKINAKVSKDEQTVDATDGGLRVISSSKQQNQKEDKSNDGKETKEIMGAESSKGEEKPKRAKKGSRGEIERLWKNWEGTGEEGSGRKRRSLKGEKNHVEYSPQWSPGPLHLETGATTTERQAAAGGEHALAASNTPRGVVMRIRKERVTKFDINDDALESLEEKAGVLGASGYAMKREAREGPSETRQRTVEKGGDGGRSVVGSGWGGQGFRVEPWMRGSVGGAGEVRTRRDDDGLSRVKRAPTTAGSSRNPKTGLSPGPAKLPFRVFLVLRYCGVDSTECDEEEAGKDDAETWRRPQTVFTKELVDFPECPKYQHQVILPCEAFGQAGVYVVQVRSNYTLETEDEDARKVERRRKRGYAEASSRRRERTTTANQRRDENDEKLGESVVQLDLGSVNTPPANSRNAETEAGVGGSTWVTDGIDPSGVNERRVKSKDPAKDNDGTLDSGGRGDMSAGGRSGRSDPEGVFGRAPDVGEASSDLSRKPRGSAWEMGSSSWWELGSGDWSDSDDGSGEWADGGRGRREGSGDAEYGDDPESGSGGDPGHSRKQLPDPPPRSLWASSESIKVRLSQGYVFTVHARSVFPCSDAHVRPDTLEPAPSGVPVLFEYPECILDASDRVRVFGRARPDVAAILPPFWMGTDASADAAVTLSHPSLRYVAEKKIYKGKHNAWFDCSLFTERYSEYCFAYASEALTGAVTHVRAQCIPTLPTSEKDRGGWGNWSPWSQCSTTCGSGSRNRYRTCDNPPPRYGAPFCEGTALETQICPPPAGVTYEELQEMCPLGLALNAADDANRKGNEPNCRCGGCVVHLQGVAGSWTSRNAGPIKPRARLIASSSQACPGRSFWLLQAEPGHVVGLTVSSLLLPCPRRQWLKARDGDSLSARLILHLPSSASTMGFSSETLCFSSGPHLLLEFYSFERLEATCNGGFLAHAHQVLANSSASAIGRDILLTPTTRAVPRSSLSVHAVALAFILALLALSGGLALNYVLRRRRFNEEVKKREKEEDEMSDSDSDTKCFIARNRDGGSATSVTSVSDVISLRKLSVGKDSKRREVHMRLAEESDEGEDYEEEDEDDDGRRRRGEDGGGAEKEEEGASQSTDHNEPAKANLPKVEVLRPSTLRGKRNGGGRSRRRARVETAGRGGVRGVVVEEEEEEEEEEGPEERREANEGGEEEGADGVVAPEVTRRRRRKGGAVARREWRESACPLLEPESSVAQSSISLPSSPTEVLGEDPAVTPNAPGRPGLSASAPLLLRRSLSFFAATASASSAGAAGDAPPSEGVAQSISAAGKQWLRKKMQRFQNGSVSPVREELEETWRLAEPNSPKKEAAGKGKKRPFSDDIPPAKECKEKQNRERLLRAAAAPLHPNPPSSTASDSPSATTSPEMSRPGSNGGRPRGRLLRPERGKCTSEASLTGGASELDLEFDYYDYNVQNAGAAPGSYLGMDPAFLVYIPPFEGSTSPSSNASSASTLQAPPSEGGTDALLSASSSPQPAKGDAAGGGGGGAGNRGDYYCINPSYARANFQDLNGSRNGVGSEEGLGEMMTMSEFRRSSVEDEEESEEGRGSEKETRVEKSPVEDVEDLEEDEIKFADEDDEEEEEEEDSERAKMEGGRRYGVISTEGVGLKKPI